MTLLLMAHSQRTTMSHRLPAFCQRVTEYVGA